LTGEKLYYIIFSQVPDMKKILVIFLAVSMSCSTVKKQTKNLINKKPLTRFFSMCEKDINNASGVIIEKDIIKNLSHLLKMGHGGKKYYLLERESISKMIKSVTKGVYSDFILINKSGQVIYTMNNDSLFAKNVRTHLKCTPLYSCYKNTDSDVFFKDTTKHLSNPGRFMMLVSKKTSGKKSFPGIFILQIDLSRISSIMKKNTEAIGIDGRYRISHDISKILSQYKYSDIVINRIKKHKASTIPVKNGFEIQYNDFNYRNIEWIITTENKI